jgi:uncharacterized protein
MIIKVSQIPAQGLTLREYIDERTLDFDSEIASMRTPFLIEAQISHITNTVTAFLDVSGSVQLYCARCLSEFSVQVSKHLTLAYPLDPGQDMVDMTPDIRQELILDLPVNPKCSPECKGLCPGCGTNLNEGGCSCGTTKKKTL